MKKTHRRFAFSYDWDREVSTCEPEYYRWNQWFFLKMLERGLAYRKKALVNWCPKCATVLANEQVVEGCCWRHEDTPVEQRALEQWFLKITAYADQLLDDMRAARRRLAGARAHHAAQLDRPLRRRGDRFPAGRNAGQPIRVFTTRVDTIYGATCVILAPEHPLNEQLLDAAGKARAKAMVDARAGPRSRRYRKGRLLHRPLRRQSVQRRAGAHLDRQLRPDGLRHRRHHGRARARRARFRILPQVRHRRAAGDPPGGWRAGRRAGHDRSRSPKTASWRIPAQWSGLPSEEARRQMAALRRGARLRQGGHHLPHQGLGHLAPALLGHADSR